VDSGHIFQRMENASRGVFDHSIASEARQRAFDTKCPGTHIQMLEDVIRRSFGRFCALLRLLSRVLQLFRLQPLFPTTWAGITRSVAHTGEFAV
jgi:hypothetical protein